MVRRRSLGLLTVVPAVLATTVLTLPSSAVPEANANAAAPMCHGRRATILDDRRASTALRGTPHADVIWAGPGADTIYGRGGNDVICGGEGYDRVLGGAGDDWVNGGAGSDTLFGQRGADRLMGGGPGGYKDDDGWHLTGDSLDGGLGSDRLIGRKGPHEGIDTVSWESAHNGVTVNMATRQARGEGKDTWTGEAVQAVNGSRYQDRILGTPGPDRINAGAGDDVIRAGDGADQVQGGQGADVINTGPGDDLFSPESWSTGKYGPAVDVVRAGPGADQMEVQAGADRIYGGDGSDQIYAEDFSAQVRGGLGDDSLGLDPHDGAAQSGSPGLLDGGSGEDNVSLTLWDIPGDLSAHVDIGAGTFSVEGSDWEFGGTVMNDETYELAGGTWLVDGGASADTVYAGGTNGTVFDAGPGDDTFFGSPFDDVFDGGAGTDTALALGDGEDTCISVEIFDMQYDSQDCEIITP